MKTKAQIPYETNAEWRTVEGWCCKTCGRFYGHDSGAERTAKYCCCTDRPCQRCETGRAEKYFTLCPGCLSLASIERFEKLQSKPYDGSPVVTWDDDRYFFDEDELLDWIAENNLEDVRLVFAEHRKAHWRFTVSGLLGTDIAEDDEWDTSEIDQQIAKWVEKHAPDAYWPSKLAVEHSSIVELLNQK